MKQTDNQLREETTRLKNKLKEFGYDSCPTCGTDPDKLLQLFSTHMEEIIKQAKPQWYDQPGKVNEYEKNLLSLLHGI